MPKTSAMSIVAIRANSRLLLANALIMLEKRIPRPVAVICPTIMPARAQGMVTITACFPVATKALIKSNSVIRVSLRIMHRAISTIVA